ncbi:3-phosphoglycerate dehydrogenase [bacterium]|nr:3-phosphoglycerate dehydrogenase [bacterium]
MFRIKTINKISKDGLKYFDRSGYEVGEDISDPDALLVRSANLHDYEMGPSLKAIGRAGAGTNNIPVANCTKRGIVVFNAPGANANAVKELVLAGMFLAARNLIAGVEHTKTLLGQGDRIPEIVEKDKSKFAGYEIRGKRLGVVGLGAIGMMVANEAVNLGMDVEGYDPFISVNSAWALSHLVKPANSLNKLFGTCDFISLHMPLTPETVELISSKTLPQFKRGAVLLNFARSEIVNEADIIDALNEGHLSAYVTDFPTELLLSHPKVICVPHLGASTSEAENNCAIMVARQIIDFLENGNIVNSVNFPNCSIERSGDFRLVLTNENVPNMVGQISSLLALDGLNIAEMVNKSRADLAYNIVDINGTPTPNLVERLRAIEGISMVRLIS